MYRSQREVPWIIDQAEGGNFQPLIERVTGSDGSYFSMGLYLSAQCPTTLRAGGAAEKKVAGTAL